jgi:hypothetical protein
MRLLASEKHAPRRPVNGVKLFFVAVGEKRLVKAHAMQARPSVIRSFVRLKALIRRPGE